MEEQGKLFRGHMGEQQRDSVFEGWNLNSSSALMLQILENPARDMFKDAWLELTTRYTCQQMVVMGSFILHEVLYFLFCIPDFIFQFIPYMDRYKIQWDKKEPLSEQWKCFKLLMFNHFCIQLPVMVLTAWDASQRTGMTCDYSTLPPWYAVMIRVFGSLVIEDTWHYWAHRFMHNRYLYKHIHKTHHDFKVPFGMTAEYSHPIDFLLIGLGNSLALLAFGSHVIVMYWYIATRLWVGVVSHSGYDVKWINPLHLLPGYAGVRPHDFHHKKAQGNFSSSFIWWDFLCGTFMDDDILAERVKKYKAA